MLYLSYFIFFMVQLLTFEQPLLTLQNSLSAGAELNYRNKISSKCCSVSLRTKGEYFIRVTVYRRRRQKMFYLVSSRPIDHNEPLAMVVGQSTADLKTRGRKRYAVKSKRTRASSSPSGFPPKGWLYTLVTHHPSNPRAWKSEHTQIPRSRNVHVCANTEVYYSHYIKRREICFSKSHGGGV